MELASCRYCSNDGRLGGVKDSTECPHYLIARPINEEAEPEWRRPGGP